MADDCRLLTVAQMYAVDAAAIESGVTGLTLMERAGAAVAAATSRHLPDRGAVRILCGPGNNGGDGFVAARLLKEAGFGVSLGLLGDPAALKGDAAANRDRWDGCIDRLETDSEIQMDADSVVDALFGAGLARDLAGVGAACLRSWQNRGVPIVAVDMPSGVHGDTGLVMGYAPSVRETVTFCRAKPGHYLVPGRHHCGRITVADIGIPPACLDRAPSAPVWLNGPAVWADRFPWRAPASHKYSAGHLVVVGGPMTGAARLAGRGARRIGVGLLTLAASPEDRITFELDSPGVIVKAIEGPVELRDLLQDRRMNAIVVGPGLGRASEAAALLSEALKAQRATVIDADGLTMIAERRDLRLALRGLPDAVATPHPGEFARLAEALTVPLPEGRLARVRACAAELGVVVVLKGPDTVVAAPDGRAAINANAPAELATAGSGDVLAGMVGGLLAQGMPGFEAACCAVWLHGAAADGVGHGLIAEDIPERLPSVLKALPRLDNSAD